MVDNSFKNPPHYSVIDFTNQRANDFQQNMSKGIPCHITAVNPQGKVDMVTVAFDIKGGSWAMPTQIMPVAFSPYGRDVLVVGDKGYASPGDYNLGGSSGLGGGTADFAPRGNLTPLVFHPVSKTTNEKRDNNQYVVTGGKNGVQIIQSQQPQTQQQGQQSQQTQQGSSGAQPQLRSRRVVVRRYRPSRGFTTIMPFATSSSSTTSPSSSNGSTTQSQGATAGKNMAIMQIDKDGRIAHTSANGQHEMFVDQKGSKVVVRSQGGIVYVGGDPQKDGGMYLPLITVYGPCANTFGKV